MKILERLFIGFPMMLSRNPIIVRIPFRIPDFSSVGESRRNNHVYFQVIHSTGYSYLISSSTVHNIRLFRSEQRTLFPVGLADTLWTPNFSFANTLYVR
jgi:hypothetical protein